MSEDVEARSKYFGAIEQLSEDTKRRMDANAASLIFLARETLYMMLKNYKTLGISTSPADEEFITDYEKSTAEQKLDISKDVVKI
ncbi:MAG: hypothetical protein C0391_03840 [Anaerolinea sp.]|nr:hypothetical protein [Anaerolinea sp.]